MPGFLSEESFWEEEGGSALLQTNTHAFVSGHATELVQRVQGWAALCGASDKDVPEFEVDVDAATHVFKMDADRTFKSPARRRRFIRVLLLAQKRHGDYHQAMGFVISFLMLFLDDNEILKIVYTLNDEPKYNPGYWKASPAAFKRDAEVYWQLLNEDPVTAPVAAHVTKCGVVPEAYCQKYFVGLCVHLLPYSTLMTFIESYLVHGWEFLFKFAITVFRSLAPRILASTTAGIFELMRLDPKQTPIEQTEFFDDLVQKALEAEIDLAAIPGKREVCMVAVEEHLRKVREAEERRKAEESDDEIVFSDEED